jgi:hypothetical protein
MPVLGRLPTPVAAAAMLLAMVVALWTARARACSCAQEPASKRLAQVDAVFEGRVLAVTRVAPSTGPDEPGAGALRAAVEVVRTWKGANHKRVTVMTPESGSECGVGLEAGRSYLFFATGKRDVFITGLCDGTRVREQADMDVAELGPGVTPSAEDPGRPSEPAPREPRGGASTSPAPGSGGCAGCVASASGQPGGVASARTAMLAAISLAAATRMRRRSEREQPRRQRRPAHRDPRDAHAAPA